MKKISLSKLYFIFVKIGAILLGGGYVILPILITEIVDKRKLVKEDDIINYFAISQSLPGIVAANISAFVGYQLYGKIGSIIAILGIITTPVISIIILASLLATITENQLVQGAFWGISISVIVLILLTVREVWQKSSKNLYFYTIFILSLISLLIFKFSPIQTILLFSTLGILYKKISLRKEEK